MLKRDIPTKSFKRDIPKRIKFLKKSKELPQIGDIFTFQITEGEWMYGKLIRTKVQIGFANTENEDVLIYIYKNKSNEKNNIPILEKDNILIPPLIVSYKGCWGRGYFETIKNSELIEGVDTFIPHCFVQRHLIGEPCVDENLKKVEKQKICGETGLYNIFGVESEVLRALGEEPENY